jgi:3'-phosphoadenosine 5'-phosphosulfate sulfotransferase (PAPS reductase)/FAD synthetase
MPTKRVVGFSGGIDSQATALWVRRRYPAEDIIMLNCDAGGNEDPITTEFINEYSATVFPLTVVPSLIVDMCGREAGAIPAMGLKPDDPLSFDLMALLKGRFPSATRQFCTEHLKLAPQARWSKENLVGKGIDFERYVGVRQDESRRRKDTPATRHDDYFDCLIHYPLRLWSKQRCFDYVQKAGEKINPLYTMGFNRVGCAPCINSTKGDVREWNARRPEMIDKIRGWEKRVGRTFFAPCVPGMEMNFIDDVVAWSKTERGGTRLSLPYVEADAAAGTCVSKYGLCE